MELLDILKVDIASLRAELVAMLLAGEREISVKDLLLLIKAKALVEEKEK